MVPPPCCLDLGFLPDELRVGGIVSHSPIDGAELGRVHQASTADVAQAIERAQAAFFALRVVPAPVRGEVIRRFAVELRTHKETLANLVTLECGKIRQEALGEVQEMIDICDFAVGLSRQLHGLTIASERPGHRLMEVWHPLGPVAVISAFNFPVAVWAWNFALAVVCGDPVLWKPSEKTPLCAAACQRLFEQSLRSMPELPPHICQVLQGTRDVGMALVRSGKVALVSATGSCRMGREVAPVVAARMGRCLLELGGNNATIVTDSADLSLALPAVVFSAVGTAGQRCTTLRRLFVQQSIQERMTTALLSAYAQLRVGDPQDEGTHVGPLIDRDSQQRMLAALNRARDEGGQVLCGGEPVNPKPSLNGAYVSPAIVSMPSQSAVVMEETFAPILYVMSYQRLEEAIELHNAVEQGLSSSIFTTDLRQAELFLSVAGSDCGIANVNVGPSGAEIGGAFGGEKATGGGRESGSDAWKGYMRRATNTINYSSALPLAQGIRFPGTGDEPTNGSP